MFCECAPGLTAGAKGAAMRVKIYMWKQNRVSKFMAICNPCEIQWATVLWLDLLKIKDLGLGKSHPLRTPITQIVHAFECVLRTRAHVRTHCRWQSSGTACGTFRGRMAGTECRNATPSDGDVVKDARDDGADAGGSAGPASPAEAATESTAPRAAGPRTLSYFKRRKLEAKQRLAEGVRVVIDLQWDDQMAESVGVHAGRLIAA